MVADAAPVLIGYLDSQQRYRFVNRAYEEWFGVDRAEIEGRTLREVVGEAGYAKVKDYVARALSGERLIYEGEVPYLDAGQRHIEAQFVPDVRPDGFVAGYCVLVTDISERKRAEARVAGLLEQERRRATILDLGRRLREETDPEAVVAKACEALGRQLNASQVGYGELDFTATQIHVRRRMARRALPVPVGQPACAGLVRISNGGRDEAGRENRGQRRRRRSTHGRRGGDRRLPRAERRRLCHLPADQGRPPGVLFLRRPRGAARLDRGGGSLHRRDRRPDLGRRRAGAFGRGP